jgi:eight-cysteine-cluster-containing protein
MRYMMICVLAALLCMGCGPSTGSAPPPNNNTPGTGNVDGDGTGSGTTEPAAPGAQVRTLAVTAEAALFARVEGATASNDCAVDADCMSSGCSKEVCAAEEMMTACDVQEWPQGDGASCGCVDKQCVWYR